MAAVAKAERKERRLSPAEIGRRREAARQSLASVVIEGGDVDAETQAVLDGWATGELTEEDVMNRILAPYGRGR